MDTVEELNGTYFYAGKLNLTAAELFLWCLFSTRLINSALKTLPQSVHCMQI